MTWDQIFEIWVAWARIAGAVFLFLWLLVIAAYFGDK